MAAVRKNGTQIKWEGCNDIEEKTCNVLEDYEKLDCKKGKCEHFDNVQVECISGECKDISEVYKCEFEVKSKVVEIK